MVPFALLTVLAAHPPAAVAKPKAIELIGTVKEVSGPVRPRALLQIDGGTYELHGRSNPSAGELLRLAGAKVRVYGVTGDGRIPRGKHVLVERYEIVDVGRGVVPRIGRIAQIELDGGKRLLFVDERGRADLLPPGWSKKMTRHVGAKLWMVGSGAGAKFKPQKFMILAKAGKE